MMEPEIYDGTIHPEVWLNKIKVHCYKNQIMKNEDIIEYCKFMVHPSINVTKVNTFNELINVLKSDIFSIPFKYFIKEKLKELKFENDNHIQFINKFREYCYEAEINDIEEQKNFLLKKFSKNSFQYMFLNDNLGKIKTLDDLIIFFNKSFLEGSKLIKYGSCISLKHVATGKYLSRCDTNYKTGSGRKVVFASQVLSNPNSLWIVSDPEKRNQNNPVIYGNGIRESGVLLIFSSQFKSPSTGHREVSHDSSFESTLVCINSNSTDNNNTYIKTRDIITLQEDDNGDTLILRSHEFPFTIDDETFQEVVGYIGRIGGNDKWCIELVD